MVLRWAAAYLDTKSNFRPIIGHKHVWTLQATVDADGTIEEGCVD